MIEGCAYRYIVRAQDVIAMRPVSRYALSGAEVQWRIGDKELAIVVCLAGHGPVRSLLASFWPGYYADRLYKAFTESLAVAEDAPAPEE